MHSQRRRIFLALALALALALGALALSGGAPALAEHAPAASIPATALIEPSALAAQLRAAASERPAILQVGSRVLFTEAHIPGAEYTGPAGQDEGLQRLQQRLAKLPRDAAIILYCGCCPWSRCPNIAAAYDLSQQLHFTRVRVLHLAENFGADWVDKGYPVARGE